MRILKKNGACFFFLFFCGGTRKKKYIFYQKRKEKKRKKKSGNWDLISFPHCSSVIGFFFLSFYFSNIVLYIQLKVLLCKVLKLDKKQSKTHTLLQQAINTEFFYNNQKVVNFSNIPMKTLFP